MPRKAPESLVKDIIAVCSRPDVKDSNPHLSLEPFIRIARWIPQGFSPYLDYDQIINAGLFESNPDDTPREIREHKKHREIFEEINEMNSQFYTVVELLYAQDEGDSLQAFIQKMNDYMNKSRAQDTNKLKSRIIAYLPFDPQDTVKPAIIKRDKSVRGYAHTWTARALCPLVDLATFDDNPQQYMNQVQKGTIKNKYSSYPSFLFENGTVYNARNKKRGLFRGHVLIRTLRLIYTGDSSAFEGHRDGARPSAAELNHIREVTPNMVAYGACQAYVALSSMDKWGPRDGYFDVEKFHKSIVKVLTEDHPWVKQTLDYLTSQLPSLKRRLKRKRTDLSDNESDPDDSDADPTGILTSLRGDDISEDNEDENLMFPQHSEEPDRPEPPPTPPATRPPPQPSPARTEAGFLDNNELEDEEETAPLLPRPVRGGSTRGRGTGGRGRGGARGGSKTKGRSTRK